MPKFLKFYSILCFFILALSTCLSFAAVTDSDYESFDSFADNTPIDGLRNWQLLSGVNSDAITQAGRAYTGSGKALELLGNLQTVSLRRRTDYAAVSPTWVEYVINPGIGAQSRPIPENQIAAVSFDYKHKVYATDGNRWVDTGKTFEINTWYRVILKIDFITHKYDLYVFPAADSGIPFVPAKEGLSFIDPSINSLHEIGFGGTYNSQHLNQECFVDDLLVHFVSKSQVITAPQVLIQRQASERITVQLQNALSEPQTAWRDITLELNSSSSQGEFSLDPKKWSPIKQITIPANAQEATFYYKDGSLGKPIINVKEYPDRGWTDATQQQSVLFGLSYFKVNAASAVVAGDEFAVTVTATDEQGNLNEGYNGSVDVAVNYISPSSGTMKISPEQVTGFKKGVLETKFVYPDCGIIEIEVRDSQDGSRAGKSGQILAMPARFSLTADAVQVVGKPFDVQVTAYNSQGQVTPNYKGPAGLQTAVASGGVILPSVINPESFVNGRATVPISYDRFGQVGFIVFDQENPQKRSEAATVNFKPSAVTLEVKKPAGRTFFYVGESIEFILSVVDELKRPIPNFTGTVVLVPVSGMNVPTEHYFNGTEGGRYSFLVTVETPGAYSLTARDVATKLSVQSQMVMVKKAILEVVSDVSPVGTAEVVIRITDEEGNLIRGENDLTVGIDIQEENANNSVMSAASITPVRFKDGVARILISDSEEETVVITPKSSFNFRAKKGAIRFGRVAKTGIGTKMWREIKEQQ